MRITWFGHAAFLIETAGLRVILDPYRSPDCGGYAPIAERADIVAVSHENDKYHSHLGQIEPPFEVVRGLEITESGVDCRGLRFHAVPCFESPEKLPGDEVTILHFESEGLHVVHLGDLGHALRDDEIEPLLDADVVLAAAGGPPTIDFSEIPALFDAINPRIVVPMHYFIAGKINLNIQPVERFIEALPEWPATLRGESSIEVEKRSLPASRGIVGLQPAR